MSRHKLRIYCMEIMYQIELKTIQKEEALFILKKQKKSKQENEFIINLFLIALKNRIKLINLIQKNVKNWSFERLGILEKSILLLATTEIIFIKEIPLIVSINEWVEISKKYCGESSKRFINGILNGIKNYYEKNKIQKNN